MTRFAATAVLGFVLAGPGFAQPQPPVAPSRPAYSPYLNLLRGGTSAGVNYYGLVRPEQQFRQQSTALQQQLNTTNQNLATLENNQLLLGQQPTLGGTGHGVVFNQPFRYFNTLPGGAGGGRSGGGGTGGGGARFGGVAAGGGVGGGLARPGGTARPK